MAGAENESWSKLLASRSAELALVVDEPDLRDISMPQGQDTFRGRTSLSPLFLQDFLASPLNWDTEHQWTTGKSPSRGS